MTVDKGVRIMAGTFVLIGLGLAYWVSPYWLFLAAFVAVNLIQSAFTGFCPAETMMRKCGMKDCTPTGDRRS